MKQFVLQLLEGIGTIKPDKKKLSRDSYQDSVTAPISRGHDNKVAAQEDPPEEGEDDASDNLHVVLSAIEKVVHIQEYCRTLVDLSISASQNCTRSLFKPPALPSMDQRGEDIDGIHGRCPTSNSPNAYPRCKDAVVINTPDVMYVNPKLV